MNWQFDAKDYDHEKYGNFSSPTIMKLVSKYNKQKGLDKAQVDGMQVADVIAKALNERLEREASENCGTVCAEVAKFEAVKGFLNIYLYND